MLFNSLRFILFFPLVCLGCFLIPKRLRWIWLLGASYYFYLCGGVKYAAFLLFSTLITWLSGLGMSAADSKGKKKLVLAGSFILNIGLLLFCKYFRFGLGILSRLTGSTLSSEFNPLLPPGISFYTLTALSYTMDVYRGKVEAERNFFRYALFVSFFPNILSGPIQRSRDLLPQLKDGPDFDFDRVRRGLWLMLWGYFQKMIIGDRLAIFVNGVYGDPTNYVRGGLINILTIFLYAFQIYLDFDGYSNIAIGAAEVLGFRTAKNFERPFFSGSFNELWNRWHISLSRWFIDCVYIPLGGNRRGTLRTYLNTFAVFVLSGLWHGASWNYAAWGAANWAICTLERVLTPARQRFIRKTGTNTRTTGFKVLQSVYVTTVFSLTCILFHSSDLNIARAMLKGAAVFNPQILFTGAVFNFGLDRTDFTILFLGLLILLTVSLLRRSGSLRSRIELQPAIIRLALVLGAVFAVLLFGIYGPGYNAGSFLYLQF